MNSNYEKKLPMKYPKITCYNQHANLLAIISSESDSYLPWLYNYYIQLQFANNIKHPEIGARLDFENLLEYESCPFLYYQKISRDMINLKWDNVIDFMVDCIDQGYCIYFTVDSYWIHIYKSYKKEHFIHPLLIYGYNFNKKVFYVADNCYDGKYSFEMISFDELIQGYIEAVKYDEEYYLDSVNLYQYRKRERFYNWYHNYAFDVNLVKLSIEDFLSGKGLVEHGMVPLEQWKRETLVYGVNCYKHIINYLKNINDFSYDSRTFFVLHEHKKIMLERIEYMQHNQYMRKDNSILENYKQIENTASIMNSLWLKYGITKANSIVENIIHKIEDLEKLEIQTMTKMLKQFIF